MRDHHADRRLDLFHRAADRRRIGRGTGNGAVVDMIDRVCPEGKHLGQPAADLVDEQHHAERGIAIEASLPRGGDRHRIKIVVAKLAGNAALAGVVAEVRAVGIPLADGRGVGGDRLFHRAGPCRAQADATPATDGWRHADRLPPKHGRRIGPVCQGRHAAADAVEMKLLHSVERCPPDAAARLAPRRIARAEKVEAITGQTDRLVLYPRQQDGRPRQGFSGR